MVGFGGVNLVAGLLDGEIIVTSNCERSVLNTGQSAFITDGGVISRVWNVLMNVFGNVPNSGLFPETMPSNFEYTQLDSSQLFVAVSDGAIVITDSTQPPMEVNRGKRAFVYTLGNVLPQLLTAPLDVLLMNSTLSAPLLAAPQCAL